MKLEEILDSIQIDSEEVVRIRCLYLPCNAQLISDYDACSALDLVDIAKAHFTQVHLVSVEQ